MTDWFLLDDGLLAGHRTRPTGAVGPQQRLDLPDTEDDTFSVTYTTGSPFPNGRKTRAWNSRALSSKVP